jgi:hypothetical protein
VITITLNKDDLGIYEATLWLDPYDAFYDLPYRNKGEDYGEEYQPGVGRHPTRTGAISNAFLSYRHLNGREAE